MNNRLSAEDMDKVDWQRKKLPWNSNIYLYVYSTDIYIFEECVFAGKCHEYDVTNVTKHTPHMK